MRASLLAPCLIALLGAAPQEAADSNPIDDWFRNAWRHEGHSPAPAADDFTFLRRATLDLCGRLPAPDEVRAFAADKSPDKRARLLDRHLASDECADFLADVWLDILVDHVLTNQDFARADMGPFKGWLRACFYENVPYDRMVRALLSDRGSRREFPAVNFALKHLGADPLPVKLSVMSARLFLGRDIRCAQCHDDPYGALTQEEFWSYVEFFRPLRAGPQLVELKNPGRANPRDDFHELQPPSGPVFLDGRKPDPAKRLGEALADLTLNDPTRAFAKAFIDRTWRHFFGRRLAPAKPSAAGLPGLLDALAARFERDGFSVRKLLRLIVRSEPYQLSSAGKEDLRKRYAVGPLKTMGPVQYFRVFTDLFTLRELHAQMYEKVEKSEVAGQQFKDPTVMQLMFYAWAQELLLPRGRDPEEVEGTGTARMAMKFMNNRRIQDMISGYWGRLKQVCDRKSKTSDRIEELHLLMVGRYPTDAERRELAKFAGNPAVFERRPFEDIFWMLLNSSEFIFNH